MYSIVIMAALTGGAPSATYFNAFSPCCPCGTGQHAQGGVVHFFWLGASTLTEGEIKEWADYLALLDLAERAEASEVWRLADDQGKRKLLKQVNEMRPKKDEPVKKDKDDKKEEKKEDKKEDKKDD
jgi:hypothetical protein